MILNLVPPSNYRTPLLPVMWIGMRGKPVVVRCNHNNHTMET